MKSILALFLVVGLYANAQTPPNPTTRPDSVNRPKVTTPTTLDTTRYPKPTPTDRRYQDSTRVRPK